LNVEQASKVVAAAIGVAYVLGLLATNLYLLRLGVADFTILRAQYLLTGALFLLPILACAGCWQVAFYQETIRWFPSWMKSTNFVIWFVAPILLNIWLTWDQPDLSLLARAWLATRIWFSALLVVIAAVGIGSAAFARPGFFSSLHELDWPGERSPREVLREAHDPHDPHGGADAGRGRHAARNDRQDVERHLPSSPWLDQVVWAVAFSAALFIAFLWYSGNFTQHIFPFIPQQLGGGRAVYATLVLQADAGAAVTALGIRLDPNSQQMATVTLLLETTDYFVISLDNGAVARLRRTLVDAVAVHRPTSGER
jgi:hypothetical protein